MTKEAAKFYGNAADKFENEYGEIDNLSQDFLDLLRSFVHNIKTEGEVLDAGCGTGRDVKFFEEQGLDVVAVDLADQMVEKTEKRTEAETHKMDVRDLEFRDNRFSGVWCITVLIFLSNDDMQLAMNELARVCKEGAPVVIGLKRGKGKFIREKYGSEVEQNLLTEENATNMIREAGMEIKKITVDETNESFDFMNIIAEAEN